MSHFVHSNFFSFKTLSPVGVLIENKMVTTNYTAQIIMCWHLLIEQKHGYWQNTCTMIWHCHRYETIKIGGCETAKLYEVHVRRRIKWNEMI
jgi:hypothetical protein